MAFTFFRHEHDVDHVLEEEDAIEKHVASDLDHPDQAEVHKELLEAHTQQEKERTALDKVRARQPITKNTYQQLLNQTPSIPHTHCVILVV